MKTIAETERRRGGQIRSDSPVAKVASRFGIGYREMAEQTGISYSIIKRLAIRDYTMTKELARRIASRYEVSAEYILELDPGDIEENGAWRLAGLEWKAWRLGGEPAGVAEEVGLNAKERDTVLIAALNDCAKIIDYKLPESREEKATIGDVCTWFAVRKYPPQETAKWRPEVRQALKVVAEMHSLWKNAAPIVKKKQIGDLSRHFFNAYFTHLPARKVKAHTDLMRSLDALARDAQNHPQAPLIRKEIIKAHVEIRHKFGLK